jgi:hypothetical protein
MLPVSGLAAPEWPLAAAIDFNLVHAVFSQSGLPVAADYRETGLTLRQWLIPGVFSLGVRGGILDVTEDANPALHGAGLSGAYGGLDAGLHSDWTRWLGFAAYGSETYHRASAQYSMTPLRIRWYGFHARMGPVARLGMLTVGFGAYYRRVTGAFVEADSASVVFATQSGPYASVALATGARGRIKLVGEGGRWHAYLLSFRYGF